MLQRNEPGMGMGADLAHRLVVLRPKICNTISPRRPSQEQPRTYHLIPGCGMVLFSLSVSILVPSLPEDSRFGGSMVPYPSIQPLTIVSEILGIRTQPLHFLRGC